MSCGVGHRCVSNPALLWLWRRPAATAPIRSLAGESPYAAGAALEKAKRPKKKKKRKKSTFNKDTFYIFYILFIFIFIMPPMLKIF